jgi:hypothetical protein
LVEVGDAEALAIGGRNHPPALFSSAAMLASTGGRVRRLTGVYDIGGKTHRACLLLVAAMPLSS